MKNKNFKIAMICIIFMVGIVTILFLINKNNPLNKNTNYLEGVLSQRDSEKSGIAKELFNLDYGKVYVFQPYLTKNDMENQIGFKCSVLKESVNEGMVNILFTKNHSPVAYLYGYPSSIGYFIDLPIGEYEKDKLNTIRYNSEIKEVGNSDGNDKTYIYYSFGI